MIKKEENMKRFVTVVALAVVLFAVIVMAQEAKDPKQEIGAKVQQLAFSYQVQVQLREEAIRDLITAQGKMDSLMAELNKAQAELKKLQPEKK